MTKQTQILEIVKKVAKQDVAPDPEEPLFEAGYLDSFSFTDLISELEAKFGISIPDSDLIPGKFDTVAKIESYIESHA